MLSTAPSSSKLHNNTPRTLTATSRLKRAQKWPRCTDRGTRLSSEPHAAASASEALPCDLQACCTRREGGQQAPEMLAGKERMKEHKKEIEEPRSVKTPKTSERRWPNHAFDVSQDAHALPRQDFFSSKQLRNHPCPAVSGPNTKPKMPPQIQQLQTKLVLQSLLDIRECGYQSHENYHGERSSTILMPLPGITAILLAEIARVGIASTSGGAGGGAGVSRSDSS